MGRFSHYLESLYRCEKVRGDLPACVHTDTDTEVLWVGLGLGMGVAIALMLNTPTPYIDLLQARLN